MTEYRGKTPIPDGCPFCEGKLAESVDGTVLTARCEPCNATLWFDHDAPHAADWEKPE